MVETTNGKQDQNGILHFEERIQGLLAKHEKSMIDAIERTLTAMLLGAQAENTTEDALRPLDLFLRVGMDGPGVNRATPKALNAPNETMPKQAMSTAISVPVLASDNTSPERPETKAVTKAVKVSTPSPPHSPRSDSPRGRKVKVAEPQDEKRASTRSTDSRGVPQFGSQMSQKQRMLDRTQVKKRETAMFVKDLGRSDDTEFQSKKAGATISSSLTASTTSKGLSTTGTTNFKSRASRATDQPKQVRASALNVFEDDGGGQKQLIESQNKTHWDEARAKARGLIHSNRFEFCIISIIIINSLMIGLQIDFTAENGRHTPLPLWLQVAERIFVGIFSMELLLRIFAEGRRFVWSKNWKFHLLDTIIVVSAWLEHMMMAMQDSMPANMNAFAALRIIRLVRVARSVRLMEFSRDLRSLIHVDKFTYADLIENDTAWEPTCMTIDDVVFCESDSQAPARRLAAAPRILEGVTGDTAAHMGKVVELQWNFGNLPRGMYTLFKAISGGQNWGEICEPFKNISWILVGFFVLYVGIVIFAVLNIVMSIFIENARKNALRDKNNLIWEEIQERSWRMDSLKSIFKRADKNGDDFVDEEEFIEMMENHILQAFFRTLGLDFAMYDYSLIFNLFDADGDGILNQDDFIAGCLHFQGNARSMDLMMMRLEYAQLLGNQMEK